MSANPHAEPDAEPDAGRGPDPSAELSDELSAELAAELSANPGESEREGAEAPRVESDPAAEGGIVERALRRLSDRRDVVIWEGEPVEPGPELAFARDARSPRAEKLRSLRTELLMRLGTRKGASAFAIVGASPSEGRSLLCAELALAFSQLAGRTLLVDANLRRPTLDKLFRGARADVGLADVLEGTTGTLPLHKVVGPTHMALLTAGTPPAHPVDLLSGAAFERLVRDWRRSYDYILIDTPPASLGSDGCVVANAVGNVLLVARQHKTTFAEIADLRRRLDATRATIVGAVLNDF
jgi:capsular exopolysaccharide synthesis family protein